MKGKNLKLIVIDGCAGLKAALDTVFPYVPRQHCWVHKLRNVSAKLPRKVQKDCLSGARNICQSSNRGQAMARFRRWDKDWRTTQPKAVACLERDLEELLNFLDCPDSHRIKVRTTNAIERSFREVRRRTRPMSCFQNSKSVERIVYGVISHLNANWKGKPIAGFTHNT